MPPGLMAHIPWPTAPCPMAIYGPMPHGLWPMVYGPMVYGPMVYDPMVNGPRVYGLWPMTYFCIPAHGPFRLGWHVPAAAPPPALAPAEGQHQ